MSVFQGKSRRTGRRRDTASPARVLTTAAISVVVVAVLVALSLSIYQGVPWVNYETIYATVPQTGDMLPHDPVRIAGVRVGQVSGISVDAQGSALLTLQLDPGTKLPTGTGFQIRADGLLGARYVQLVPGPGPGLLHSGITLHGGVNSITYGVPDALNVFNRRTRGALGADVTSLGQGLLGRGTALNGTIHQIAAESTAAQQLIAGLVGPGHLQALVPSLNSLLNPLYTARADIGALLAPAAASAQPFVDQRSAVRAALDALPGALDSANAGLSNGNRLLDAANSLATQVSRVLPLAPAGLAATTTLLKTSHPALVRTRSLLVSVGPAVPAVLQITGALRPLLPRLGQTLGTATPALNQVAPYGCNIENFGAVIRSMTGFGAAAEPGGPGGPAMAFRLQVIPASPSQMLGIGDTSKLFKRDGYYAPCQYLASAYPTTLKP
jgi:phospholipid/cholesterol/gamma-HCH transport system substrate-binding protein